MAKKKKKKLPQPVREQEPVREVPKFEIGVKGDEFDIKYTEAARRESEKAEKLFLGISRESSKMTADLLSFAVLGLTLILMALSFAFLSHAESLPKIRAEKLADGSYFESVRSYYSEYLPFGDRLRSLGSALGLYDYVPKEPEPEPEEPPAELPAEPVVTTVNEPEVTTAPPTTAAPATVVPETETTPYTEPPETFRMYANTTANIRLRPDHDSMIMGYFYTNERVEVIEISEDGWASIWYGGTVMYVRADNLSERRTVVTAEAVTTEETTEPEVTTEEETTEEETTAETTAVSFDEEETTEATTAQTRPPVAVDPEMSAYLARQSRSRASAETEPPAEPDSSELSETADPEE